MNACIDGQESSSSVRGCVVDFDGLECIFSGIDDSFTLSVQERLSMESKGNEGIVIKGVTGHSLSRCVGLLSRLTAVPKAFALYSSASYYRKFCKLLAINVSQSLAQTGEKVKNMIGNDIVYEAQDWVSEERGHLLRILSSITAPSAQCKFAAKEENFIEVTAL
jgi:hypothetical protein